jgi:hypothetical protein
MFPGALGLAMHPLLTPVLLAGQPSPISLVRFAA